MKKQLMGIIMIICSREKHLKEERERGTNQQSQTSETTSREERPKTMIMVD